jgi:hypothetical protein
MPYVVSLADSSCVLYMQLTEMREEGEEIHQEEEEEEEEEEQEQGLSVVGRSKRVDEGKAGHLLTGMS